MRREDTLFLDGEGRFVTLQTRRMQIRLGSSLKRSFKVSFADCYILGVDLVSLVNLVGVYVGIMFCYDGYSPLYRRQSFYCVGCVYYVCVLVHFVLLFGLFYVGKQSVYPTASTSTISVF